MSLRSNLFVQRSLMFFTFAALAGLTHAAGIPGQGNWETTLQPRDLDGNGVTDAYYDTALDVTWLADADFKATLGWDDSQADGGWPEEQFVDYLAGFGHLGVTSWRLPAIDNPNQGASNGELEHMYLETLGNTVGTYPVSGLTNTGPFVNLQPTQYLYGTNPVNIGGLGGDIYADTYGMGYETNTSAGAGLAWVVADGDVQPLLADAPEYEVIDLGTLGGQHSDAYGINNNGQIVGSARNANNQNRAFLYEDGSMQDLGTLMPDNSGRSAAYGINNSGDITGFAAADAPVYSGTAVGFIYSGGTMSALGALPTTWSDDYISLGRAINDSGVIAVNSYNSNFDSSIFGVRAANGTLSLDPNPKYTGGPIDINSAGIAAGNRSDFGDDNEHILFSAGTFSLIASDYVDPYGPSQSLYNIYDIDDNNQLAGRLYQRSCGSNFCDPAVSYGMIGSATNLPITGNNHQKVPGSRAIHMLNAAGDMAGKYAYRWIVRPAAGPSYFIEDLLDTPGWQLNTLTLRAMNDRGDLVGTAQTDGGLYRAVLLHRVQNVKTVAIDIDPYSTANNVNPTSDDLIAVAVLSTNIANGDAVDFDATQVDPSSLKFGTGEAPHVVGPWPTDVGGDGDTDVLFGFQTQATNVLCDDTTISLTGETYAGEPIEATDTITTVDCEGASCHP